jgi:hypothetical protein
VRRCGSRARGVRRANYLAGDANRSRTNCGIREFFPVPANGAARPLRSPRFSAAAVSCKINGSRFGEDRAFGARLFDIVNRYRRGASRASRRNCHPRSGQPRLPRAPQSVSMFPPCFRHRANPLIAQDETVPSRSLRAKYSLFIRQIQATRRADSILRATEACGAPVSARIRLFVQAFFVRQN